MLIKKLVKHRYILIFLLLVISGFAIYLFSLPPRSEKDTLQVMRLKADATSTFRLESQLSYTPDLISQLKSNLTQTTTESSPIHVLNISISLGHEPMQLNHVVNELVSLATYVPKLTISLIPDDEVNETTYMNLYNDFTSLLVPQNSSNIEVICYPLDLSSLKQYTQLDSISSIGVNINSTDDLEKLNVIYNFLNGAKKLYIRENLLNSYSDNIRKATEEINAIYYTLAIQYPECQTIFSPLIKLPFGLQDAFVLTEKNPDYATYQSIYGRLLTEPWLTLKELPLATTSPYELLDSYDILTGTEEILLAPGSTILPGKSKSTSKTSYIHYRLEDQEISVQSYYPYVAKIDTTSEPNGITRFKALGYNSTGEITEVQSIDLTIQNDNAVSRAVRSLRDFPLTSQMIYTSKYIPILMYHTVAETVSTEENNSCVEIELFDAQMKALIDNGYTPINFKVLYDYINGVSGLPEKPILITMDDGYLNNYTNAYPIYKKYNIPATLFVSPYFMEEENTERHFGWKAAKEMEDSGLIDIQSHGYNHTPLPYLSLKDVRYHISRSKGLIEKNLGPRDVFVVAYPQFRNTSYTRKLLSELGIDLQITKLAERGTVLDASNLKRINVPNTMSPEELISTLEKLTN